MNTAVITGASSGIGLHTTRRLLESGWSVFGLDLALDGMAGLRDELGAPGRHLTPVHCDVGAATSIAEVFAQIGTATPKLNALVACAGVLRSGPLEQISVEDFDLVFQVNVRGSWLVAKHAMPLLKAATTAGEVGRVVFLSSVAASRPKIGSGVYAASKVAVSHLARVLAVEVAQHGVLVNALAPATVDTPMNRSASGHRPSGRSPLGRIAVPEDVTRVIRFLLSEESSYITGATIPVDGGTGAAFVPEALTP